MSVILPTILISAIVILIAVFLLGFRIFLFKDGKFPNIHIGSSKPLRDRGITCATSQDKEAQQSRNKFNVSNLVKEIEEN